MRELILSSSVVIPGCTHLSPQPEEVPRVYTTAKLGWKPLVREDPTGPQFATLWGDPSEGNFGAVVQLAMNSPQTYTLVRRRSGSCSCDRNAKGNPTPEGNEGSNTSVDVLIAAIADAFRLTTTA